MSSLNFLSVREVALQIKAGEVSAVEVIDVHLAQIRSHNAGLLTYRHYSTRHSGAS